MPKGCCKKGLMEQWEKYEGESVDELMGVEEGEIEEWDEQVQMI